MEFQDSITGKAVKVIEAANQLAREFVSEGEARAADELQNAIQSADWDTLARLYDLLHAA